MPSFLDEYLIKLGTAVDAAGFARFHQALRESASAVDASAVNMAKSLFKAQTEIVGGFTAIGLAALGLVDKVAMADQEYRLFALHMFMSKDAARGLKVAMDALGQPLENLAWDPELRGRTRQLLEDQRAMAPTGDFNDQMRKVRDIRFEFTRMEVEVQYLGMHVVQDFLKALGMGPDDLLTKLRYFNDWITKHLPEISHWIVANFLPVWRDVKMIVGDVVNVIRDFATLFDNIIGMLSGDYTLEGVANFDKFARSVEKVVHWLALVAHFLLQIEGVITGVIGGAGLGGVIGSIIGGVAGIPGGPAGIAAGVVAGGVTGTAVGGAVGGVGGGVFDLLRHLKVGPWSEDDKNNAAVGTSMLAPGGVDKLMSALMGTESGSLGMSALSNKGAIGSYQLMPATAKSLGVDPHDAAGNKRGAYMLMQQLMEHYGGNVVNSLGAYNAGQPRMDAFLAGKATLPDETKNYIGKVLGRMGASGSFQVGSVTVQILQPNASPAQIQRAVTQGIADASMKRVQRNLAQFNDLGWSY